MINWEERKELLKNVMKDTKFAYKNDPDIVPLLHHVQITMYREIVVEYGEKALEVMLTQCIDELLEEEERREEE